MSNWDADKLDCYEIWDTTLPPIPPRSRLFNLKPIGIGTPYVESLTGYIVRLAEEHHLTVKDLVVQEIFPLLSRSKNLSHLHENWAKGIITLNGTSSYTKDWVDALEQLTHNANLSNLTMLIWQNVISQWSLLRATQAWCPLCYEEWRRNKNDIYHPLVWALKVVNVCLHHCVPLQTRCPQEDCKKTLPLLSRQMRLGYCSHCMRWLGISSQVVTRDNYNEMMTNEDIKRQYWVANNVGEIVKVSASLSIPLSKDKIASTLTQCSKQLAEDSLTLLARQIKSSRQNMFSWQQGLEIPCLESLLKLCDGLGITLCRFLTETVDDFSKHVSVKPIRRDIRRSTPKKELHQKLEAFLFENPPLSIKDITTRLGYRYESSLYGRCPELCHAITARYRQWHKNTPTIRSKRPKLLNKGEERKVLEDILDSNEHPLPSIREINRRIGFYSESRKLNHHFPDLCRAIIEKRREQLQNVSLKQALENILSEDIYPPPSLTEVAEKLGYTYDYLNHHFPTLSRAIVKRYRQLFDVAVVRKILEVSLSDNSVPPPSLQAVARQVGFNILRLYRQFPDLCPKIVLRYQTYRKDQHNARMQNIHDEVENAILQLYAQECYPSLKKVEKLLQDKLSRVEVGYFWRGIMQELALDGRESLNK